MLDIVNKNTEELTKKYDSLLTLLNNSYNKESLIVALDFAINHIKEKYNSFATDRKTWLVMLIKHQHHIGKITSMVDIVNTIAKFVDNYNHNYKSYVGECVEYSEQYDKDESFLYKYLKKINQ